MKLNEKPIDEIKLESKSSKFDDDCDATSTYLESSPESSDSEQTDVDDSENDSGYAGIRAASEVDDDMNESLVKEPVPDEKNDREEILCQLANLASSEGEGQFMLDVIGLKFGPGKLGTETFTESSRMSQYAKMTPQDRQKSLVEDLRETLEPIPDSMMQLITGWFCLVNTERPFDQKPDWLDMDKLRRGQKFSQDYIFPVYYCMLICLPAIFTFESGILPLIISGNSSTPYTAFKRYLSTALRFRRWYTQDSWTKGTAAQKDIMVVRAMHAAMTRRMTSSTNEELDAAAIIPNAWCPTRELLLKDCSESCEVPVVGQCPYVAGRNNPNRPKGINQTEMALTQWSFMGLIILYPKSFGIHDATDEDLEAFCHLWKSIGYQLGIEDEYNFCSGTLEEIRQRSRDVLEVWIKPNLREITSEWEHMMRSFFTGMGTLLPLVSYEMCIFHLLDIVGLRMPRFYASLSYKDWISYNLMRYVFRFGTLLPGITGLLNTIMNTVITRFDKFTPKQLEGVRIKLSDYK